MGTHQRLLVIKVSNGVTEFILFIYRTATNTDRFRVCQGNEIGRWLNRC